MGTMVNTPTLSPSYYGGLRPSILSLKTSSSFRLPIRNRIEKFELPRSSFCPKRAYSLFGEKSWNRLSSFCANAGKVEPGNVGNGDNDKFDEMDRLARGESTMPDRFRYLTKEAPDPPLRWPLFVALAFLVYAWRAVLFELSNWKKAVLAIIGFAGYLSKLALALLLHFIGDPITSLIRCVETAIYSVRAFYSGIVAYAHIPELTTIIMLASSVLAIGEAAAPDSVSSQPYILSVSALMGYAAVKGYISEQIFWTLLALLYSFSRLVKKRDDVTSALPVAAVLAAVGEPWVRVLAIASYAALAIFHYWRRVANEKEESEAVISNRRVPMPLLLAALAIGVRVAAKWAGYRHLTWMIV